MHPKGNPRIDRSLLFLASCESEGMIPSKSGSLSCVCMHVCINVCLYVCLHIFGEFIGIQLLSVFLRCLFCSQNAFPPMPRGYRHSWKPGPD